MRWSYRGSKFDSRSHIKQLKTTCGSGSSYPLLGSHRQPHTCRYTHIKISFMEKKEIIFVEVVCKSESSLNKSDSNGSEEQSSICIIYKSWLGVCVCVCVSVRMPLTQHSVGRGRQIWVPGQSGLHREILYQKKKEKREEKISLLGWNSGAHL